MSRRPLLLQGAAVPQTVARPGPPAKPFPEWTREDFDASRARWREWQTQHDEEEKQRQAERAAKRAEARRQQRADLARATKGLPPDAPLTVDEDAPIYALEVLRRYAKDLQTVPPDWRILRPCLKAGALLQQQTEWQHEDARQVEKRLHMLRQLLPRELDAALNAIIHGLELRAQAREVMAFSFGFTYGASRNPKPTSAAVRPLQPSAHGPLRLTLAEE